MTTGPIVTLEVDRPTPDKIATMAEAYCTLYGEDRVLIKVRGGWLLCSNGSKVNTQHCAMTVRGIGHSVLSLVREDYPHHHGGLRPNDPVDGVTWVQFVPGSCVRNARRHLLFPFRNPSRWTDSGFRRVDDDDDDDTA